MCPLHALLSGVGAASAAMLLAFGPVRNKDSQELVTKSKLPSLIFRYGMIYPQVRSIQILAVEALAGPG
jgi:hypothetical protein